ncbi:MAG TPA: RT0821/Lpp0805 family surface protein [Pseudolabrys sp.]|nr:RT0821/Lpp0805 family surface protein [Pseudolabrys sp.]
MATFMARRIQECLYTETAVARLWRRPVCARLPFAAALVLGLSCGGCSLPSNFDSLFAHTGLSDTTGSITPPPGSKQAAELPPERDLVYTRAAVSAVLARGGKDASFPWENPQSGARGTVTPIASAYTQDGAVCHDFLASYISGSSEAWMQGEACRQARDKWEVRSLKPWKRS